MKVLITGMSGVGKSTVLRHLDEVAIKVELDEEDWMVWSEEYQEEVINIERLIELFESNPDRDIFLSGTAINQGKIYPYLDAVITLTAPLEIMKSRIQSRTDNPFGKSETEWAKIVADKEEFEARIISGSDLVINTDQPIAATIQEIIQFLNI
ncbi:AAA family ATPase [Aerococcaceae bacterium DSM 111176]|nr:AAA family ATPase [Aerococcaceae bacterium DSM 111176]